MMAGSSSLMLAWVSTFVEMTEVRVVILGGASRQQSWLSGDYCSPDQRG